MQNLRSFVFILACLIPGLVSAQTNCVLRAGESVEIPNGQAMVFINVYQSGMRTSLDNNPMFWGPSGRSFQCRVKIDGLDIPVAIEPFTLRALGPYSAVLAGPARLTVERDSLITHRIHKSSNFDSYIITNTSVRTFDVPSGKVYRFFMPLLQSEIDPTPFGGKGYSGQDSLAGQIRVLGTTITNSSIYPPFEIAGPAAVDLGLAENLPFLEKRNIVTIETRDAQTAPIIPANPQGGIKVESSGDLSDWSTVFSTNQFLGGRGFYRLRY